MHRTKLPAPAKGASYYVNAKGGRAFELDFDPANAKFDRSERDLSIKFDNGEEIRLGDFFVAEAGDRLPVFRFKNGQESSAEQFLTSLNPDFNIDPSERNEIKSGGLNAYRNEVGDLVDGVDRLGSQDSEGWSTGYAQSPTFIQNAGSIKGGIDRPPAPTPDHGLDHSPNPAPVIPPSSTPSAPDPGPAPTPPAPDPIPTPVPEANYSARAVLYFTGATPDHPIGFRLLDASGRPVENPGDISGYGFSSREGLIDVDSVTLNADGTLTFKLSAQGLAALAQVLADAGASEDAENIYDYITVTINGKSYTMQVVLNQSGEYDSAMEDAANEPGGPLHGEWHSETGGSGETGDIGRNTGNGHDEFWFHNQGVGLYESDLNTGLGDDRVSISGTEAGTENSQVTSVNGTVGIHAAGTGGEASGMKADGDANSVTAKSVSVSAESAGAHNAYGLKTSGSGAENIIQGDAGSRVELSIHAKALNTGNAYGLYADSQASNSLENIAQKSGAPAIHAESTRGEAYAVYSKGGAENTVSAASGQGLDIEADAYGSAYAVKAGHNGANTITSDHSVNLAANSYYTASVGVGADMGGKNIIKADNGVTVESGLESNGVMSWGAQGLEAHGGENLLEAKNGAVIVRTESEGNASYGLLADDSGGLSGKNIIQNSKSASLETTSHGSGGYAMSLWSFGTSENIIRNVDDINIKATATQGDGGSFAIGAYASGGSNVFENADSLNIDVLNKGNGTANAMHAAGGNNVVTDVKTVHLTATTEGGSTSRGLVTNGSGSSNIITGADEVSIRAENTGTGFAFAMETNNGGQNTVEVNKSFKAEAEIAQRNPYYTDVVGMYAKSGGTNTVRGTTQAIDVEINANVEGGHEYAMYASNGHNVIEGGKYQAGTVQGDSIRLGGTVQASSGGTNTITTGNGNDVIHIQGGVNGSGGINVIDMKDGDDSLTVTGYVSGYDSNKGSHIKFGDGAKDVNLGAMGAGMYGQVTLTGSEGSSFNLTIGKEGSVHDTISNYMDGKITIDTGGKGLIDNIVIHGNMDSMGGGYNAIYTRGGNDTVTLNGYMFTNTSGKNYILFGGGQTADEVFTFVSSKGMLDNTKGKNVITTSGDMGNLNGGTGNDTLNVHSNMETRSSGENSIHTGSGDDTVKLTGTMLAMGSGTNAIYTNAGNDMLFITGDLIARIGGTNTLGGPGKNLIDTGTGDDLVSIKGSITTQAGGKNIINTGEGNDTIILEGYVGKHGLELQAGNGNDTLILMAADLQDFRANYSEWISCLNNTQLKNMSVETLELQIGDPSNSGLVGIGDLDWLLHHLGAYNESNPSSQISTTVNVTHGGTGAYTEVALLGDLTAERSVTTGGGDDVIMLHGKAQSGFTVNTGGGNDQLILLAGSESAFNANYENWLKNGGASGFESITAGIAGGGDISLLAWLQSYAGLNDIKLEFTGQGDDIFILEQDMGQAGFTLRAGDGYDVLVLKAATMADFQQFYENWITKDGLDGTGFEAIKVDVDASFAAGALAWLQTLLGQKNIEIFASGYKNANIAESFSDGTSYNVNAGSMNAQSVILKDGHDVMNLNGTVTASTIDTGAGDDLLTIAGNVSAAIDSVSHIVTESAISTGDGNDTVSMKNMYGGMNEYTDNGNKTAVWKHSTLDTGSGDDKVRIESDAELVKISTGDGDDSVDIGGDLLGKRYTDNSNDYVRIRSEVNMGDGDDTLNVGRHMTYVDVDMGEGNNRVNIGGLVQIASITAGAGDDSVDIHSHTALLDVDMGDGENRLHIRGDAERTSISSGSGNDEVRIDYTVEGSVISTGAGNDSVFIKENVTHWGLNNERAWSGIHMGDGDDALAIGGNISGGTAKGDYSNPCYLTVDAGDGNNSISVGGTVHGAKILSGSGDDTVFIKGEAAASLINTGSGDDTLIIKGGLGESYYIDDSGESLRYMGMDIDMGSGNDTLLVEGSIDLPSIRDYPDMDTYGRNHIINMGDGDDHLYINGDIRFAEINGGAGTDTLHLNGAKSFTLGELLDTGKGSGLRGFEILDLSGGEANSLTVDELIVGMNMNARLESAKFGETIGVDRSLLENENVLRITGDSGLDSVNLGNGWNASAAGQVNYDGVNYNLYHNEQSGDYLLVQAGLLVI